MAFNRFRPTSHFIAPHSWANDPCGAIFVPETREYIVCYQWNPGKADGGNSAWGMAKSSDLVTWEDCPPALKNGTTYDRSGVFSGCIVSRLIEEKRVLFLFYTSVSALPIHWSKPYIAGCETQSLAFSEDLGNTWRRYENNPILSSPPRMSTSGWRDPFVSPWPVLSKLLGLPVSNNYMLVSSGEKGQGPQIHIYQSGNLLDWDFLATILNCKAGAKISPTSKLKWGQNFECGAFFTFGKKHYLTIGVEEDNTSRHHNQRYLLWIGGDLILENKKPKFVITNHGLLDHGISYAAHLCHDAEGRLLQLGWADEALKKDMILTQGWAGCLAHPRELFLLIKPYLNGVRDSDIWDVDQENHTMTTLGIRPASQLSSLRKSSPSNSLKDINCIRSISYEIEAVFQAPKGNEKFILNIRQSPDSAEITPIIFNLQSQLIIIDRSRTSQENIGSDISDFGSFELLPEEDLKIHIYVDNSIVEVYANDRFALTSRVYPSLKTAIEVSYDFGGFEEERIEIKIWEGMRNAWPKRIEECGVRSPLDDADRDIIDEKLTMVRTEATSEVILSL